MLSAAALSASAESVALFSFTVSREAEGTDYTIELSSPSGLQVQVDWGDGELSAPVSLGDYDVTWNITPVTGKIAGPKITVYGEDPAALNYLELTYKPAYGEDAKVKTIDVSKLTGIVELTLSSNAISSLDISGCSKLQKLNVNNNALTSLTLPASDVLTTVDAGNTVNTTEGTVTQGTNQVLGTDWSKCPNLGTLNLNGNDYDNYSGWWPDELDISKNTKLTTLQLNCCNLPELDVTACTLLKTFNAQWNKLTTIDLSKLDMATIGDNKLSTFLTHNNLSEIKLPNTSTNRLLRLNIANNAFTFATLPPATCVKTATNFVYSPQADIINTLDGHNTVDLSSLATVGETASVFTWTAILDGATEPTTLSEAAYQYTQTAPGVFRFDVPVKDLKGQITNEVYSKLTLNTTTATSVGLLGEILSFDVTYKEGANTINIGLIPTEPQNVYVDWGDGVFAGPYALEVMGYDYTPDGIDVVIDGWDEICPEVKGNKIVVKGNPETIQTVQIRSGYTWGSTDANMAQITAIDLSKVTNLVKLSLDNNALTSIDLSKNTKLKKVSLVANKFTAFDAALPELTNLNISNEQSLGKLSFGANKIETLDYTKFPELIELTANACGLKPDFAKATKLEDVSLMANGYTEFAPVSATINRLSLNYNDIASFDGTGLTAASVNVFVGYNKLGAQPIKLPAGANNVNIANNKFTFATLPALDAVQGTLTYNNQADMEVEANNGVVDLASQATAGGKETVYAWADGEGNAIADNDFTAAAGVFTFNKDFTDAVCTMTNEAFPNLTLKTVKLNITAASAVNEIDADDNAPVEFFNLQGVKVSNPENGVYIRRQGSKAEKVIL